MLKRVIMLILSGLIFCSCDSIGYTRLAIYENIRHLERERERKEGTKKDAPGAISNDKYKEDVEKVIQDISKRPVNKKIEFEGTTLTIPEGTRINPKHGNIVDERTGYGIALAFQKDDGCTPLTFYTKKVRQDMYILIYYNYRDKKLDVIGQKIIKANSLTNTCK